MKSTPEVEQLRDLLTDTITLLIKNGLKYKAEFCVEALIGITLDQEDVVLVNIKEIVKDALRANQSSQQREPPEQEDNIRSNSVRALNKRKIDKEDHGSSPIKQLRMSAENSLDGEDSFQSDPKSNSNEDHSHSEVVVKQEPSDDFSTQADSDLDTSLGQRPALSCWPDATFQGPPDSSQVYESGVFTPIDISSHAESDVALSPFTQSPYPSTSSFSQPDVPPISPLVIGPTSGLNHGDNTGAYACPRCERRYAQKRSVTRHIRSTHSAQAYHTCPICYKSSARKYILIEHARKAHPGIDITALMERKRSSYGGNSELMDYEKDIEEGWVEGGGNKDVANEVNGKEGNTETGYNEEN